VITSYKISIGVYSGLSIKEEKLSRAEYHLTCYLLGVRQLVYRWVENSDGSSVKHWMRPFYQAKV
jgi:hypothetical protein